jgi:phage antirepressor YoqD-like protein
MWAVFDAEGNELAVRDFDLEWTYDLPPAAAEALADYHRSKAELERAQARYADQAQRADSVLSSDVRASVRDVARLMGISYQRVAQVLSQFRQSVSNH